MFRFLLSRWALVACAAITAGLSGCIEAEQAITLNPDGSGRINVTLTTAINPAMFGGLAGGLDADSDADADAPDPKEMEAGFAEGMTEGLTADSEGIDVWTPAIAKTLDDGRMQVTLTGYFPDINKVRLGGASGGEGTEVGDETGGEAAADTDTPDPVLAVEPAGDGLMRIRFVGFDSAADLDLGGGGLVGGESGEEAGEDLSSLSGAALKAKVVEERQAWQFAKGMMQGFLGSLKFSTAVKVPGTIVKSHNVETKGSDVASNSISGSKLIGLFDKVHMDDELAAKALKASKTGDIMDGIGALSSEDFDIYEALFGMPGVPEVTVKISDRPLFDYAAAVKSARKRAATTEP